MTSARVQRRIMLQQQPGYFILGISTEGHKFRPSDWVERIASLYASYGNRRLSYNPLVVPASFDSQAGLFVHQDFEYSHPSEFKFIMDFAESNTLQIIEFNQYPELQNVA